MDEEESYIEESLEEDLREPFTDSELEPNKGQLQIETPQLKDEKNSSCKIADAFELFDLTTLKVSELLHGQEWLHDEKILVRRTLLKHLFSLLRFFKFKIYRYTVPPKYHQYN